MNSILRNLVLLTAGTLLLANSGCQSTGVSSLPKEKVDISKQPWGRLPDGTAVDLYTLRNRHGVEAKISNYGGIVTSLLAPDRNGKLGDVVLGYDQLDGYLKSTPYFGCLVGRYANRIAKGKFTLEGKTYTLATNNGPNHLHGGVKGFDKAVWAGRIINSPEGRALELTYTSKDGEEGYPGNLKVTATYTLTADNGLRLDYRATTDQPTVLNLTQHSYFNLAGQGDVLGHVVEIAADRFTPVDATLIPTGELAPLANTPLDFRKATAIGARIEDAHPQMQYGGGYDHNYVFPKRVGDLTILARVAEPNSGRVLEVISTEPGMQFYTGNFLDGTITGKGGWTYQKRNAFCMEPGHYPDSPNQKNFPSTVLRPGQSYQSTIIYRLSVRP